jgi:hypothetical protein
MEGTHVNASKATSKGTGKDGQGAPASTKVRKISTLIEERGGTHGDFPHQARCSQALKSIMGTTPNWEHLHAHQREALEMISTKISRICYGDPNCADHWDDIAGYAQLGKLTRP